MTSQRKFLNYIPFKKNDWIYGTETGLVLFLERIVRTRRELKALVLFDCDILAAPNQQRAERPHYDLSIHQGHPVIGNCSPGRESTAEAGAWSVAVPVDSKQPQRVFFASTIATQDRGF